MCVCVSVSVKEEEEKKEGGYRKVCENEYAPG